MKSRIFEIIEPSEDSDKISALFDYLILGLILLTIIAIVLESYEDLSIKYHNEFKVFEVISITIFTIEYLLRLWTADLKYDSLSKSKGRIKFTFSAMSIIDLLAILPFYLPFIFPFDLRFLRIIRLTRLFRLFKLNRYSKALNIIGRVFKERKEELLATIFIMFFIIIISSTLMYYVENQVQPQSFPNIIASFWWSISTLTGVWYGDIYPITALGRILASVIAISGIGLVALPTGIISSGFMNALKTDDEPLLCKECGAKIERQSEDK